MTEIVYATAAVFSGIAAILAWVAKLRWSAEYREANDRMIYAKDAEIASLRTQLELIERVASGKLLEWATTTKESLERALAETESKLIEAQDRIREMAASRAADPGQDPELDRQIQQERENAALLEVLAGIQRVRLRLQELAGADERVRNSRRVVDRARKQLQLLQAASDEEKTQHLRDSQDAKTKLQAYRDRGHELKVQIATIHEEGPEGRCPTCERPLGDDFPRIVAELTEQWELVKHDGMWWKARVEQLDVITDRFAEGVRMLQAEYSIALADLRVAEAELNEARDLQQEQAQLEAQYETIVSAAGHGHSDQVR